MRNGKGSRIPTLDEARSRFEQWRRTRRGKTPIPDELWSAAIAVARRDGVNPTAVALRLDGGKLKRRMAASGRSSRKAPPGRSWPSSAGRFGTLPVDPDRAAVPHPGGDRGGRRP